MALSVLAKIAARFLRNGGYTKKTVEKMTKHGIPRKAQKEAIRDFTRKEINKKVATGQKGLTGAQIRRREIDKLAGKPDAMSTLTDRQRRMAVSRKQGRKRLKDPASVPALTTDPYRRLKGMKKAKVGKDTAAFEKLAGKFGPQGGPFKVSKGFDEGLKRKIGNLPKTSPGFDKALKQRISTYKATGMDERVPIKGSNAYAKLLTRNKNLEAEINKKLRGYTPGEVAQTPTIRAEKSKVVRLLQSLGFLNPRGKSGIGMANNRTKDMVE